TIATKSRGLSTPAASIACSVNTLSVPGTLWIASSRLRAVTTTSSSVWVCAHTGSYITTSPQATASTETNRRIEVSMRDPLLSFDLSFDSELRARSVVRALAFGLGAHDLRSRDHGLELP